MPPSPDSPGAGRPGGERFPASSRIRRAEDIRTTLGRGKRKRTEHLDVFFAASPVSRSRYGTIVPKHGNRIVDRNRVRRRLREVGRRYVLPRLAGEDRRIDVLVRARREAYRASFEALREEVTAAVEAACSEGC